MFEAVANVYRRILEVDDRNVRAFASLAQSLATRGKVAEAIPPEARDLRAVADALLAARRIAPVDEQAFPAYINKLRR